MIQTIGEILEHHPLVQTLNMRKKDNFQDLADKATESALKWAIQDSLKEGDDAITTNFCKMVQDFNAYTNEKYASPHDFVIIKEESIRNRLDEVFFILTEINQKGLLHSDQLRELNIVLLSIAASIEGFGEDEEEEEPEFNDDDEIQPQFDDEEALNI